MSRTYVLNGRTIYYSNETEFRVETAPKSGPWRTRNRIKGSLEYAIAKYEQIKLPAGRRKRLFMFAKTQFPVLLQEVNYGKIRDSGRVSG